ncbi:hypothetical protein BDW02DRAFT_177526 [Decorospora gaudefroyi]|uniref:Secreted protein n=1 Tax=Decorospora gaudefroyi TaxID=184978 RepID=A0A6A5JY21_9PLEO|nr:hypothetical protein BDW02DRAFT_177526 [Decorospora gaudefroyi]
MMSITGSFSSCLNALLVLLRPSASCVDGSRPRLDVTGWEALTSRLNLVEQHERLREPPTTMPSMPVYSLTMPSIQDISGIDTNTMSCCCLLSTHTAFVFLCLNLRSVMDIDTPTSFLPRPHTTTAVMYAEATCTCVAADSLDVQIHDRTRCKPSRPRTDTHVVQCGFEPRSTTYPSARKHPGP